MDEHECPYCQSTDNTSTDFDMDSEEATDYLACNVCGCTFYVRGSVSVEWYDAVVISKPDNPAVVEEVAEQERIKELLKKRYGKVVPRSVNDYWLQ